MLDSISLHIKNFLSTSIIVVCLVSKLPQIYRVIKSDAVGGMFFLLYIRNLSTSAFFVPLPLSLPFSHQHKLGVSTFSLRLEIFRQLILTTYHYHHGYGVLMYLDHVLILIQQSILFYLVSNAKNHRTDKAVHATHYCQLLVICVTVILPKYTFDYLIVSNAEVLQTFILHNFNQYFKHI